MQPNASRIRLVKSLSLLSAFVLGLASYSLMARSQDASGAGGSLPASASEVGAALLSGDWPSYGRDAGAQRFSPLTQITPQNVHALTRAWTFDTEATAMQVTPLVFDGVMYVTAGANIFALESETAKVLWKFSHEGMSRRGLAYWPRDGRTGARFYTGAGDGRMIAVDVKTGTRSWSSASTDISI